MRNFVQPGDSISLTAPYNVNSGDALLVGAIFAVAMAAAAVGEKVNCRTKNGEIIDLTAVAADTIDEGQKVYWDNAARKITEVATNNTLVGAAAVAKGAGVAVCRVRLNGTVS